MLPSFPQALEFIRGLQKGDVMLMMGLEAQMTMQALVDIAEMLVHRLPLPFGRKNGPLLTCFLNTAKCWCIARPTANKIIIGVEASTFL